MATRPKDWLDALDLQQILPHRYPFLMVDRLVKLPDENATQIVAGMKVAGLKNVSFNEPYFSRTFPWESHHARRDDRGVHGTGCLCGRPHAPGQHR